MKDIYTILHKRYDKDIRKLPKYKTRLLEMQNVCKEFSITKSLKDEFSYYQFEIIYENILNKLKFEDTFLTTYVTMHDFWSGLDYKERRHHMNVDIDRMRVALKSFQYLGDTIYMPMFDARMNRLYTQDIALFELKQYARYTKEFKEEMKDNLYGVLPYQMMFTSCQYICGDEHQFTLYNGDVHRLYFIREFVCEETLSLCPEAESGTIDVLEELAQCYWDKEDERLGNLLIQSNVIEDKVKKKIEKYLQKQAKKK